MPYIEMEMRDRLDPTLEYMQNVILDHDESEMGDNLCGVLSYVIQGIAKGFIGETVRYSKINDIIGAFECCKLETYRRLGKLYVGGDGDVEFRLPSDTEELDKVIKAVVFVAQKIEGFEACRAGILNYVMTIIFLVAYNSRYEFNEDNMCDVFDFSKQKIYRDVAASYEDDKIKSNGDVYDVRSKTDWEPR